MKLHAGKDVWQDVRNAERQHGDQAEERLAAKIHELTEKQRFERPLSRQPLRLA